MSLGRTLMIQGTASSVGKSLLVAALCRHFRNRGMRVAPFKSQNMALNSFATPDGLEIGRAQAVQAAAAGIAPSVDMNPILLKPQGQRESQVVVMGKVTGRVSVDVYHGRRRELTTIIAASLERLRQAYELVVIEGAGSPAEINLRDHEIVNMHVAQLADAPVLLVGDIDRGGVFASLVGTLELLRPHERARIKGFIINKFRGERSLLDPGLQMLEERTQVPVVGVVPHVPDLRIAEEDSVALDQRRDQLPEVGQLRVACLELPHISNYDDLLPLEHEPDVSVTFTTDAEVIAGADLLVLPGSKSTVADLAWLRQRGLSDAILTRAARQQPILGICAGFQVLTQEIIDEHGAESDAKHTPGLGLLPCKVRYASEKVTRQVAMRVAGPSFVCETPVAVGEMRGYEIRMGQIERGTGALPAFTLSAGQLDGCIDGSGSVLGTMIHGLFDNDALRAGLLKGLATRRGLTASSVVHDVESEYERLGALVADHLDGPLLRTLVGIE